MLFKDKAEILGPNTLLLSKKYIYSSEAMF